MAGRFSEERRWYDVIQAIHTVVKGRIRYKVEGLYCSESLPSVIKGGFYRKLASYGHVGRMDLGLPWELTDKAYNLKA
jgi:S-adenosylmethionine synthetase